MKFCWVWLLFVILLMSCQQKLQVAAAYNTQLGLAYFEKGEVAIAKQKIFKALSQAPNSPDVYVAMAYLMEKTGEINRAETYYKRALVLAPAKGGYLNNYGAFLCRQRQFNKAEIYFLRSLSDIAYGHHGVVLENAGLCALEARNFNKAKYYFMKALEHDPNRQQSLVFLNSIARQPQ